MSTGSGAARIYEERRRQVREEGFTAEHDAEHNDASLADAAACYVSAARQQIKGDGWGEDGSPVYPRAVWPWGRQWWKPSDDPIRNLEKAGALIAAEIDRLEMER